MANRDYVVKQISENTWLIVEDESGKIIHTITKDTIIDYCKHECDTIDTDYMSADGITESTWWCLNDDYGMEFVDNYCPEFDKFLAWFDYICVEYLAKEMVAFYKQRLLNCK